MNDIEFKSILNLDGAIRYEYFIKKVADYGEIWGLYDDGWATTTDDNERVLIPFWPKKEFAEGCAVGEWSNYIATSINLEEFIEEWLPGMQEDSVLASVFWNGDDSIAREANKLLYDLEIELEKY